MSPNRIGLGFQDPDPQRARFDSEIVDRINDSIGVTIEIVTPATANTEFGVRHENLGKKVREYRVIRSSTSGVLSASSPGKWTKRVSFFKFSAPSDRIRVRLT